MLLLSGPGAALTVFNRFVIASADEDSLDQLVDSFQGHENGEVVEEGSGRGVASGGQMDVVGADIRKCLFRVECLVLFALEPAFGGIGVAGEVVTTSVGIVRPERKLFAAVHGVIVFGVLRKPGYQWV